MVATPAAHASSHQLAGADKLALSQYDHDNGQQGIITPGYFMSDNFTGTLTAGRIYMVRFVPSRSMAIKSIAFGVSTAATTNDSCDAGIYSSAASPVLLGSAGLTAGKLNATGVQSLNLTATLNLTAGTVYYSAFLIPSYGGTGAVMMQGSLGSSTAPIHTFFGTTPGLAEAFMISGVGSLTSTISSPGTAGTPVPPVLALREF